MKPQVEGLTPGNTNGGRADAEAPALPPRHHDSGPIQVGPWCADGGREPEDTNRTAHTPRGGGVATTGAPVAPRGARIRPNVGPTCQESACRRSPRPPWSHWATKQRSAGRARLTETRPQSLVAIIGRSGTPQTKTDTTGTWACGHSQGPDPQLPCYRTDEPNPHAKEVDDASEGPDPHSKGSLFEGPDPLSRGPVFKGPDHLSKGPVSKGPDPHPKGPLFEGPDPHSKGPVFSGPDPLSEGPVFEGPDPLPEGSLFRGSGPLFEGSGFQGSGPPVGGSGFRGSGPPAGGFAFRGSGPPFEGSGFRGAGPPSEGSDFRGPGPPVEGLGYRRGGPPVGGPGRTRSNHANQPTPIRPTGLERVSQRRPGAPRRLLPATPLGPPCRVTRPIGEGSGGSEATSCPGSWSGSAETFTDLGSPVIRMLRSGRRRRPLTSSDGAVGGTNDTHGSEGSPRTAPGPGAGYDQDGHSHSASPVPVGTQTEPRSRSSYSSLQLLPPRATMAPVHQRAPQVPVRPQTQQTNACATIFSIYANVIPFT